LDVIPVTLLHLRVHFLRSTGGDRQSDLQDIKVRFRRYQLWKTIDCLWKTRPDLWKTCGKPVESMGKTLTKDKNCKKLVKSELFDLFSEEREKEEDVLLYCSH
ncbi:MAG TPA: hypothetical protein V6C50_09370, partial [Crinalium sp.]